MAPCGGVVEKVRDVDARLAGNRGEQADENRVETRVLTLHLSTERWRHCTLVDEKRSAATRVCKIIDI